MVRICLLVLVVNFCNAQSWVRDSIISGYSQDVSNNEYPKITSYMGYYLWVDSLIERTDSLLTIAIAFESVFELNFKHGLPLKGNNYPNWVIVKYGLLDNKGRILKIIEKQSIKKEIQRI